MPMHDWTKVEDSGSYHVFHGAWLYAISDALNGGLLPPGYYAMPEQRVPVLEADVLTLRRPDRGPAQPAAPAARTQSSAGLVERAARVRRSPQRRVVVRHVSTHKPVAVVELISPANTANRREYRRFVAKAADLIDAGIHLLVIDPFRPPPLAPAGLHAAIWKAVARPPKGHTPFAAPADRPLLVASYRAAPSEVTATLHPFAVGEPVPDAVLALAGEDESVSLPLEATYAAAYPRVPQIWRDVLER